MTDRVLLIAVSILGAGFLLCLGGIIWLASANPARSIPDVLVATTGGILGALVGVLVPNGRQVASVASRRPTFLKGGEGGAGELDLLVRVVVLVIVVLLVIWLVRVLLLHG